MSDVLVVCLPSLASEHRDDSSDHMYLATQDNTCVETASAIQCNRSECNEIN